jgi:MarR family transcriptional regulator, organic hydroperoxide resistance regulator
MPKTVRTQKKKSGPRLDRQLCFPLYAASRLLTRLYQPILGPLGLTYPQYIALMALWEDAPCTVSHVGERALLNTNTLTPLLKRLEQLKLIRRVRSNQDERVVNIELTEAGKQLEDKCSCIPETLYSSIGFARGKAAQLKQLLDELLIVLRTQAKD